MEGARGKSGGDEKDPHDLAFSPKHVTRASVVDNMLMALDQFSNPTQSTIASREPPNASLRYNSIIGRRRAHTFSSDVSSDNESRIEEDIPAQSFRCGQKGNRTPQQPNPRTWQPVPSLCEEDESDTRHRVFDSQRAFASPEQRHAVQTRIGRRSGKSSGSSSVDLGQALSMGKLGTAGNRRSQSFDFGSDRRRYPLVEKDTDAASNRYHLASDIEAAPTPIVYAGPRRGQSPTRHNQTTPLIPIYDATDEGLRNSTKSFKSPNNRKGRAGTMGNTSTKGRDELGDLYGNLENIPPIPTCFPPHPQSPTVGYHKPSQGSLTDLIPHSKEKPGFFRRVFGPKTASATTLQATESESGTVREGMIRSSTEDSFQSNAPVAKTPKQPTKECGCPGSAVTKELQKKSSAFFRRRKKSLSEVLTPLPLTSKALPVEAEKSSPVSSLRRIMDPYIGAPAVNSTSIISADDLVEGFHTTAIGLSQHNDISPTSDVKAESFFSKPEQTLSKLVIPGSTSNSSSKVPQQDHQENTFLADSSGTDEFSTRSRQKTASQSSDSRSRVSPSTPSAIPLSETMLPVRFPFTADTAPRAATPSSGSRTPRSPSSPTLPDVPVTSKTTRPSNLRLQGVSSNNLRRGSAQGAFFAKDSLLRSGSDLSIYKSAPSTPFASTQENDNTDGAKSPTIDVTASPETVIVHATSEDDQEQALKIFENRDENLDPSEVSAWLGDAGEGRVRVRIAYMSLFDWTNVDILSALRGLCARIALKGETQQVDRMLEAFSKRWCECNRNHGFKSFGETFRNRNSLSLTVLDVVHTICYSILLLNTDLHLADIGQKMTRSQFIRNTLPTIRRVASDSALDGNTTSRQGSGARPDLDASENHPRQPKSPTSPIEAPTARSSLDDAIPTIGSARSNDKFMRDNSGDMENSPNGAGPLVSAPFVGSIRAWESQIEYVLKRIYASIARERLPLFGAQAETAEVTGNLLSVTSNMLRRSPSTLSKAASEHSRVRGAECRYAAGRWVPKTRSRPPLHPVPAMGSARTSIDEGSSVWSPSVNSTWSKVSLGKTLTSMSVDSLGSEGVRGDFHKSIGFANALSQAIIREDPSGIFTNHDEGMKAVPLLDDESLELRGAPWAKEGSLKHKHHLDGVDKRAKGRNWSDSFAVIEKGWMRLFSFSMNAKSMRLKAKDQAKAGGVVGGGNWMDSAEEVWKFLLRQTIASALPDPGYSKARPYVWALSLPTGAVHLFQVGTPEIVQEFVSTANYWSARLSKEPMMGGISNMEYGWSDAVINRALISSESNASIPVSGHARPSVPSSLRSSIDQIGGGTRPKLPGDKITINEWAPPQQSMMASQLMEVDQLRVLQAYVKSVEDELARHNELRPAMQLAFSTRHANTTKAMANWEKKSSYFLREIVKFKTYVDSLTLAQKEKEKHKVVKIKSDGEN